MSGNKKEVIDLRFKAIGERAQQMREYKQEAGFRTKADICQHLMAIFLPAMLENVRRQKQAIASSSLAPLSSPTNTQD